MPGSSIYPSIPMPGTDPSTYLPALEAMRQTLNLIILNGLSPNPNYTPSERAQVFTTYAALNKAGVIGPQGPPGSPGPPGASGVPEAPDDVNTYGRHALGWKNLAMQAAALMLPNSLTIPTNSTYVMQGLALVVTLANAKNLVGMNGVLINSNALGETDLSLFYGTGTPPANGVSVTGTAVGGQVRFIAGAASAASPFGKTYILQGLTPGTPYWFDLAARAMNGTGAITDLDFYIHGIP